MDRCVEVTYDQRAEEEAFLLRVQEGIEDDIEFTRRGGVRSPWRGCGRAEILERLRRHMKGVSRAIQHVRDGGPLDDIVAIVWEQK